MSLVKAFCSSVLVAFLSIVTACEYEPVDFEIEPPSPEPALEVTGTYKLTAYETSVQTDLDSDGVMSYNQMDETTCFNNNDIVINPDHTFTAIQNGLSVVFDGSVYSLDCLYNPYYAGTWTLVDNILKLNFTVNGVKSSIVLEASTNKLINKVNDAEIITMGGNGQPVKVNGNIEMVYTKQI